MNYSLLAQMLFPHIDKTPDYYETVYPPRNLPEGAKVTRFAPSPTGFVHVGSFFPVLICERLAHMSGGVFYLRIEDTDQKREVPGAIAEIIDTFAHYGAHFDEGGTSDGEKGDYGPYRQSERAHIYQSCAKYLVERGLAYPCFCTEDELASMRETQEKEKANFGYYGKWAVCRDLSLDEIKERLESGKPYVLRLRSSGSAERRFNADDLIKGKLILPENDIDYVLLKSDGIPTYHFAHVVDDHFMRTTHVVRGDEWLATFPLHMELFKVMGFKPPKYMHISPLMKQDGDSKRKLSKRHDPEAALSFYQNEGYPPAALKEYIMTLLNSNFEDWRRANPLSPLNDFPFSIKKMSPSGALFDIMKLRDVCKNTVSLMSADEVLEGALEYYKNADPEFFALLDRDKDYAKSILQIGRGGKKPRKDIAVWSDIKPYMDFFYDELFTPDYSLPENVKGDAAEILDRYAGMYVPTADQQVWFDTIKVLAQSLGYAPEVKQYKMSPDAYKGHVGDVSMVLRVAVTGRQNSPDLYECMKILGRQRVLERLEKAKKHLQ